MKRRSHTLQNTTKNNKTQTATLKKKHVDGASASKNKNSKDKNDKISKARKETKAPVEDYVMINGEIYKADTNTDRLDVHHFVSQFKRNPNNYINYELEGIHREETPKSKMTESVKV